MASFLEALYFDGVIGIFAEKRFLVLVRDENELSGEAGNDEKRDTFVIKELGDVENIEADDVGDVDEDSLGIIVEIEFNRLSKLSYEMDDGVDLETYGFLRYYDKSYDKISTKAERSLQVIDGVHYNPTTTDDPVIQKLGHE
ncbi:unnamed protein product [Pneumocystis jirovecii]|uniref:Uncharacterized protein n=1 Tax=Pneumocystis jirovecii TaxID=42068 RepID=L0PE68_PNEJI|nr:unnamed protein product [Pneumocystis jirovecii]